MLESVYFLPLKKDDLLFTTKSLLLICLLTALLWYSPHYTSWKIHLADALLVLYLTVSQLTCCIKINELNLRLGVW